MQNDHVLGIKDLKINFNNQLIPFNCSMFCCTLFYVHSSIANILMWKRELVALLNLSSWCLDVVE